MPGTCVIRSAICRLAASRLADQVVRTRGEVIQRAVRSCAFNSCNVFVTVPGRAWDQ
jgi:hypothetical protein